MEAALDGDGNAFNAVIVFESAILTVVELLRKLVVPAFPSVKSS